MKKIFLSIFILHLAMTSFAMQNRKSFSYQTYSIENTRLRSEICGICKKSNCDLCYWYHPRGNFAHMQCVKLVFPIEKFFFEKSESIRKLYNLNRIGDYIYTDDAHIKLVEAVQKACGNLTILEYANKYGVDALDSLYINEGKNAYMEYYLSFPWSNNSH